MEEPVFDLSSQAIQPLKLYQASASKLRPIAGSGSGGVEAAAPQPLDGVTVEAEVLRGEVGRGAWEGGSCLVLSGVAMFRKEREVWEGGREGGRRKGGGGERERERDGRRGKEGGRDRYSDRYRQSHMDILQTH